MSQAKNLDEYINELEANLDKNPNCGNTHYNLGVAYLSQRRLEPAEREFTRAAECSPTLAEAMVQLGGIAMHKGDLQLCLECNIKASQMRGRFAVPHGNIGFVHLQMGEFDKAEKALRKAVSLDSEFVQAIATLGSALLMQGKFDESIEESLKAVKIEPKFGPAYNNLALAHMQKGEFAKAVEYADKALETGYQVAPEILEELKAYRS